MKDEKIETVSEVWLAIRYLDPDEQQDDRASKVATAFTLVILAIIVGTWLLLCFRGF
jgi:hypothetical protein